MSDLNKLSSNSQNLLLNIYSLASFTICCLVLVIFLCHFLINIFRKRKNVKLTKDSFVIITGGCTGIGRQMIKEIAKKYHSKILIIDYKTELFQELHQQISDLGSICEIIYCDLRYQQEVKRLINYLKHKGIQIDLFINNAGIVIPKKVLQMTDEQHMMQMNVNFFSPVKIVKEIIKQKLTSKGHIAIISSMITLAHGGVDISSYSSSKNALSSYINCLRQQLKADKSQITISVACPYFIKTQMFKGFRTKIDFLFKPLNTKYVAKRLIKQFIDKKQVCYLYLYEAFLFKIISFMPTQILDQLSIQMNTSNFQKIKDKHKVNRDRDQQYCPSKQELFSIQTTQNSIFPKENKVSQQNEKIVYYQNKKKDYQIQQQQNENKLKCEINVIKKKKII